MAFKKISEPQKWSWYNSERREEVGSYTSNIQDKVFAGGDTTVQTFIFEVSDTPKTTTLLTLANGVTAELTYTVENDTETGSSIGYRLVGEVKYKGKDGREILPSDSVNVYSNYRDSPDMYHVKFYYIPAHITYDNNGQVPDTGLTGAGIDIFGSLSGLNPYIGLDSHPPRHSDMDINDYLKYYNGSGLCHVYNWEEFADRYDKIEKGGDDTPISKEDPDDDTSDPDPGKPDYDPTEDPVPFPDIPEGGDALSTGFIHAYQPIGPQLQALAAKLWSDSFVNTLKKVQNDPFEAIISLHSIPLSVAGSNVNCVIGNYDSEISMPKVNSQWAQVSMGSYYIPQHWGSALDYAPYVTVDIFLPYIGVRSLQVDDIIGKTISIRYNVDVLSGAAVASIMCQNSVLYTYNCNISMEIPVTQSSYGPLYQSILQSAGAVLSGYGAAGAPGAAGAAIGSAINVAMSKQHSISRGGNISGNFGCMAHFYPYLIIHRPKQSLAAGFNHFKGKPSNITTTLSSISGYTEIESIHLDGIKCTQAERDEIRALLFNGVIF